MGPLQSCKESVGALRSVIVVAALKRKLSGSKRSSGETELEEEEEEVGVDLRPGLLLKQE